MDAYSRTGKEVKATRKGWRERGYGKIDFKRYRDMIIDDGDGLTVVEFKNNSPISEEVSDDDDFSMG